MRPHLVALVLTGLTLGTQLSGAPKAKPKKSLAETLPKPALQHYEKGRLLFADGDFASALLEFQQAHTLAPEPRLLWNMAVCEKNLRHYTKTASLVQLYLDAPAEGRTKAEDAEARTLLETVRGFIGRVVPRIEPAGAAVDLDGAPLGKAPVPPVEADMGPHTLHVSLAGYRSIARTFSLPGGADLGIDVALVRQKAWLRIDVTAGEAVFVDGAPLVGGELEVPPGHHLVRVAASGKKTWELDVTVADGETRRVTPRLESTSGVAWPWIVGGAALIVGASVTTYLLLRPTSNAPEVVPGTIPPGSVQLPLFR